MKIFIEGCDATFKSTVVDKLNKVTDMKIIKGSSFELATGTNEQLYNYSLNIAEMDNIICDRYIWSNHVYTTIYPKCTKLTQGQRNHIESLIKDDSIVIHLTGSKDIVSKRLEERGDEYITTDKVATILDLYHKTMSNTVSNGTTVITFDTDQLTSNEIVRRILDMIEHSGGYPRDSNLCLRCNVTHATKESRYLGGDYCFSCYFNIIEKLLGYEKPKNEK